LKKRSKKLLLLRAVAMAEAAPALSKSFLVTFFQKSNFLLDRPLRGEKGYRKLAKKLTERNPLLGESIAI
jgi:hypothetical protein